MKWMQGCWIRDELTGTCICRCIRHVVVSGPGVTGCEGQQEASSLMEGRIALCLIFASGVTLAQMRVNLTRFMWLCVRYALAGSFLIEGRLKAIKDEVLR